MTEQTNWKAIDAKLITRAWEDDAFRAILLSDPKKAISQAGLTVPQGTEIKVVEEASGIQVEDGPGVHYLVLPAKPAVDPEVETALSDEELENVAGGWKGAGQGSQAARTRTT